MEKRISFVVAVAIDIKQIYQCRKSLEKVN